MIWVLDTSIFLGTAFADERSAVADAFFQSVEARDELWAPALWWYEVANAVTVAQRRHRLTEAETRLTLQAAGRLPLRIDTAPNAGDAERLWYLAREHELSAYDAAYLELCERRDGSLATLDERLEKAAGRAGLRVFRKP